MATKVTSSRNGQAARTTASARTTQLTAAQRNEVARIAYQLWIEGGRQHGRDREDWAKAETIVRSKLS
jgi:hypothetical protein